MMFKLRIKEYLPDALPRKVADVPLFKGDATFGQIEKRDIHGPVANIDLRQHFERRYHSTHVGPHGGNRTSLGRSGVHKQLQTNPASGRETQVHPMLNTRQVPHIRRIGGWRNKLDGRQTGPCVRQGIDLQRLGVNLTKDQTVFKRRGVAYRNREGVVARQNEGVLRDGNLVRSRCPPATWSCRAKCDSARFHRPCLCTVQA